MKKYLIKKEILLIIISAIISGMSFTFDYIGIFMWISLTPLIYVFITKVNKYSQAMRYGLLFGTIYYLIILHWIFNLYPFEWLDFGNIKSAIILFGGWIFISLIEGTVIGAILGLFSICKMKNNFLNITIIASLWGVIEYVQEQGVLGFPWGKLVISQVSYLPIVQSVSLFGSIFISFIIVIFNGLISLSVIEYKKDSITFIKTIIVAIVIFSTNILYGFIKLNGNEFGNKVNITVIQGNINTSEKWQQGDEIRSFEIYRELTKEAFEDNNNNKYKAELIFWPETAVPIDISKSKWALDEYKDIACNYEATFMTGTFYTDLKNDNIKYNSIVAINKDGNIENIYFKRQLVPFGEILPFEKFISKIIPSVGKLNLFDGNLKPGEESGIIDNNDLKIGCLICFESLFPNLVRNTVNDGAELIFIATNDSWFKDSKAVYQHNKNAIIRAIENNRYVVRAANTGISSIVDNNGKVIMYLNPLDRGYINSSVKLISKNSLYSKIGDIIVVAAIVLIIIVILRKMIKNKILLRK